MVKGEEEEEKEEEEEEDEGGGGGGGGGGGRKRKSNQSTEKTDKMKERMNEGKKLRKKNKKPLEYLLQTFQSVKRDNK